MSEPTSPALPAADPVADDPRVTRALEEYLGALEAGQVPDRRQLCDRYPDVAEVLGDYLDGLDFLHRTVAGMHTGGVAPTGSPVPFLEDYEIVREVGRGGMGIVYEAVQRSLRRRVALKVLSLGATLDPRHLQRFRNEAQAAAQLQHPHIVPVFAVGCEQGVHYYAMRFIDGMTLAGFIDELRGGATEASPAAVTGPTAAPSTDHASAVAASGPPAGSRQPEACKRAACGYDAETRRGAGAYRQAAEVGVQAAEALEHAHQMGVIHRDVKPANILLENGGQVWVADFGLARWPADDALTLSGDLLGTLRYMSPEQASARRGLVDHRTDVYSLGATLYEMVTLRPVFRGEDRQELLHQILNDDPVPPCRLSRDIPRDLETVLLKALGKQVEERYATAQELADDLRRFLDGRPVLARRPGAWERAGKWARRHRSLVGSAAALLVLTVLGLSAGMALVGRERARAQAAYEQELRARQMETDARAKEAEARARAEQNFRQAQQLVDYVAETAAADGAAQGDLPTLRRKLLQAALSYYKDFIEQQNDDQLTHEELLRGYTRVATLLDAAGRRDDARVAWNEAFLIAMKFQDDEAPFRLAPAKNTIRLLKLESVREALGLTPKQVRAVVALESKEHESAEAARKELVSLLTAEQAARLNQLLMQQAGIWAFVDPAVSESIQLTPAQRAALAATQKQARATPRSPGEKDDGASLDRITWVFTPDQRGRWHELVGDPFPGALPPPELTLASGTFTIRLTPARPAPDQNRGAGEGASAGGPPND
jgi:serine/threonine protein kinase